MTSSVLNMEKEKNFMKYMSQSILDKDNQDNQDDSQIHKLNDMLNDDGVVGNRGSKKINK